MSQRPPSSLLRLLSAHHPARGKLYAVGTPSMVRSSAHDASRRGRRRAVSISVETAKLHGIDPARYLREAALAASRGEVLLPGDVAS